MLGFSLNCTNHIQSHDTARLAQLSRLVHAGPYLLVSFSYRLLLSP